MKVFISWSGKLSEQVGKILANWLPHVIQAADPFISTKIDKGSRWFKEISERLDETNCGILCITRENMNSPWILFEAGALAKCVEKCKVIPFVIDLSPSDLEGPLAQFQATTLSKPDIYDLISTINNSLGENKKNDSFLIESFEKWWLDFYNPINNALNNQEKEDGDKEIRDNRDIIEEILQNTRYLLQVIEDEDIYKQAKTENLSNSSDGGIIELGPGAGMLSNYTDRKIVNLLYFGKSRRQVASQLGVSLKRIDNVLKAYQPLIKAKNNK